MLRSRNILLAIALLGWLSVVVWLTIDAGYGARLAIACGCALIGGAVALILSAFNTD